MVKTSEIAVSLAAVLAAASPVMAQQPQAVCASPDHTKLAVVFSAPAGHTVSTYTNAAGITGDETSTALALEKGADLVTASAAAMDFCMGSDTEGMIGKVAFETGAPPAAAND